MTRKDPSPPSVPSAYQTDPFIVGYRTPPLGDIKALLATVPKGVQLMRADRVYGADHLRHAAALAARAFTEGRARSADVATETLLYAAGERQIGKALAFLGLAEGATSVAVVAWSVSWTPPASWDCDDAALAAVHVDDAGDRVRALVRVDMARERERDALRLEERLEVRARRRVGLILPRVRRVERAVEVGDLPGRGARRVREHVLRECYL